jgi:protein-S-isoprenylcysteine O-methyltransferase Ste14
MRESSAMGAKRQAVPFIMIGALAYFGLALAGYNNLTAFFAEPARVGLTIVVVVMAGAGLFSGETFSRGIRNDRADRYVFITFYIIAGLTGYLPALSDRYDFWTFGGDGVRWLGVALFAVGGALRLGPVFVLGHRFSGLVAIQPGHSLATGGIYGIVRHPSYLGFLVNSLGWALAFHSGVGVLITVVAVWPVLARIRAEEALLRAHFGSEYDAYCGRTARLIPGLY